MGTRELLYDSHGHPEFCRVDNEYVARNAIDEDGSGFEDIEKKTSSHTIEGGTERKRDLT